MSGFSSGFRTLYRNCDHQPQHEWNQKAQCVRLQMADRKKKAVKNKRIRRVVVTGEIAHLWIHGVQDSARNGCRSMFFEGKVIFSWGHHYPIARLVEPRAHLAMLELESNPQ